MSFTLLKWFTTNFCATLLTKTKTECLIENRNAYTEYEIVENAIGVCLNLDKRYTRTHTHVYMYTIIHIISIIY